MSIPQKKIREIVFQLLYSCDLGRPDEDDLIELIMKELSVTKKTVKEALEKVKDIQKHQKEIDETIGKVSQSYSFERIQSVEKNILRIGVYELIIDKSIPPLVIISEGMRLARKFGTPESAAFINAVLDNIYKTMQGEKSNAQSILDSLEELERTDEVSKQGYEARKQENVE